MSISINGEIYVSNTCNQCGACKNICPLGCLKAVIDSTGHFFMKKDVEKCINCGLCEKVCPEKRIFPYALAGKVIDRNVLKKSSSGGIAYTLANRILSLGGVVFGATFDENCRVCHIAITAKEDLWRIQGSKYVHSETGRCYAEAAEYLKAGRIVLYTGTSCQIAGLFNYLQIKNISIENLYTQDIICHGTVLPEIWRKYVEEKEAEYGAKIKNCNFRDKTQGWLNFSMKILFENGKVYRVTNRQDLYMKIFLSDIALCDCCYQCKFRGIQRQADITLADFWGIERVKAAFFDDEGVSLVMVHSEKGRYLIEGLKSDIESCPVDIHDVTRIQKMLCTTVIKPIRRKDFLKLVTETNLQDAFNKSSMLNIGVWGSFNSRCIANRCGILTGQIGNNSIISLGGEASIISEIEMPKNEYRSKMLSLDMSKKIVSNMSVYLEQIDILFIDFLEERFGILNNEKAILTNSDALHDTNLKLFDWRVISIMEEEYMLMWKKACEKYIDEIYSRLDSKAVFLIKMFMSEKDSNGNAYKNLRIINEINDRLDEMYQYFIDLCKNKEYAINVISIPNGLMYTLINHKYGCVPEHFNPRAEMAAVQQIEEIIRDKM